MLDKINAIEARYNEINQLIEQSVDDYAKTNELMKERSDIEEIVFPESLERIDTIAFFQSRQLKTLDFYKIIRK